LYDAVFSALHIEGAAIKINNRKILSGIAEIVGAKEQLTAFTVALDKLDKIGEDAVKEEMRAKGITEEAMERLNPLFHLSGSNEEKLRQLNLLLHASEEGREGLAELAFIVASINTLGLEKSALKIEVTLARGLHYYTGVIFEVSAPETMQLGSIGGGGRYDDLTGIFGLKGVSGVGISFGLERIYLVLEELHLFPKQIEKTVEALFINFGEKEALQSLKLIKLLREAGIIAVLYPEAAKMKKQLQYADRYHIPLAVLIGDAELREQTFVLKNMLTGAQETYSITMLVEAVATKKNYI
jgi:histidyl-tRNA synthetase